MFEWVNHLVTDVAGSYIGAFLNSKLGHEVVRVGTERVVKELESHRECFYRVLGMLDVRYQKILRERLQEGALFNRETWAVNLIGEFLESLPAQINDGAKAVYTQEYFLEQLALERHFEGLRLTRKQLREAWLHPERGTRSDFLFSIYLLENDTVPQFARRFFGGVSSFSRRVNKSVNRTLKPLNNEIECQIQRHKSRWGRI